VKFYDLLRGEDIDAGKVLVLRHVPREPELKKVLPSLAADRPDVFNAYQQTQTKKVEGEMVRAEYVAAFIGREPGKALFVGLYANNGSERISPKQYWQKRANVELKTYGVEGFTDESSRAKKRPWILWFDLRRTKFYADWRGKLVIHWPPPDIAWHRWAHKPKNEMPVLAILDESAIDASMPEWSAIDLTWEQLRVLPESWKSKLSEWRGIYYIFDASDGKGYVGAAYGRKNLLGRWLGYAARGHGGNRLLLDRHPENFRFTILERVKPDMDEADVVQLESTWKDRLHTRHPSGLNDN
jgi:hypothetical protein